MAGGGDAGLIFVGDFAEKRSGVDDAVGQLRLRGLADVGAEPDNACILLYHLFKSVDSLGL